MVQKPSKQPATSKTAPPVNIRRDETVEDSDRAFLRGEENKDHSRSQQPPPDAGGPPPPPRDTSIVAPPAPLDAPSADFPVLFAGTPYANAPITVQRDTLRRVQGVLAGRGYYRDIVDGLPGPGDEKRLCSLSAVREAHTQRPARHGYAERVASPARQPRGAIWDRNPHSSTRVSWDLGGPKLGASHSGNSADCISIQTLPTKMSA